MMRTFLIVFGGMAAAMWGIALLDWLGRRHDRRHNRAA
jgi:hypothetical protein